MHIKTHTPTGHRLTPPPFRMKSAEEYLSLEEELAKLLTKGPVHFWGGPDTGIWVQSQQEMMMYSPWTRSNEAAMELIVDHEVWIQPYPVENSYCYEGKFFFSGRFYTVYVPYKEHETKAAAYRFTATQVTIAKLKKIKEMIG